MSDVKALRKKIDESGLPMTFVAKRSGIVRGTLYNRLRGIGEFTASEIVGLSNVLQMTRAEREKIFFRGST